MIFAGVADVQRTTGDAARQPITSQNRDGTLREKDLAYVTVPLDTRTPMLQAGFHAFLPLPSNGDCSIVREPGFIDALAKPPGNKGKRLADTLDTIAIVALRLPTQGPASPLHADPNVTILVTRAVLALHSEGIEEFIGRVDCTKIAVASTREPGVSTSCAVFRAPVAIEFVFKLSPWATRMWNRSKPAPAAILDKCSGVLGHLCNLNLPIVVNLQYANILGVVHSRHTLRRIHTRSTALVHGGSVSGQVPRPGSALD
mmetsp:Transcript_30601/g.79374  ORF Transcript_30601/g.79374 Transcript_30601/m.79374 type:complete len:258 (-) Transcript_30601:1842-2615(-)